jgi:hypothetical protein
MTGRIELTVSTTTVFGDMMKMWKIGESFLRRSGGDDQPGRHSIKKKVGIRSSLAVAGQPEVTHYSKSADSTLTPEGSDQLTTGWTDL